MWWSTLDRFVTRPTLPSILLPPSVPLPALPSPFIRTHIIHPPSLARLLRGARGPLGASMNTRPELQGSTPAPGPRVARGATHEFIRRGRGHWRGASSWRRGRLLCAPACAPSGQRPFRAVISPSASRGQRAKAMSRPMFGIGSPRWTPPCLVGGLASPYPARYPPPCVQWWPASHWPRGATTKLPSSATGGQQQYGTEESP